MDEVCKKDYSGVLDNIAKSVVDKLGCELTYQKAEAADPTKIVLCPTMCTTANGSPGAKLEALVGCKAPLPR